MQDTLAQFPGTVLWVTHDRGEAWRSCRRVCVMDRGVTEPVMTMAELFRQPGTQSAARLSGCKNYVPVLPAGQSVDVPAWGITLNCGREVPAGTQVIGIRSHHIHPAEAGETNAFSCAVERVIDDVFGMIVLLRSQSAAPDAPLLRMELPKEVWAAQPDRTCVTVSVAPEDILLLK